MATTTQAPPAEQFPPFGAVSAVVDAYRAADVVTGNVAASVWRQFVRYAHAVYQNCPGANETARTKELTVIFRSSETRLDSGPLPASYRSAKSTILAALGSAVSLLDQDGNPRAKSELAAAVALVRKGGHIVQNGDPLAVPAIDPSDKAGRAARAFVIAAAKVRGHGRALTPDQRVAVLAGARAAISDLGGF